MALDQQAVIYTATNLNINFDSTLKVLQLSIGEDCTIPFISRYRKEATGGMDEVQVANILSTYNSCIEREKT